MYIIDLTAATDEQRTQAARLLHEEFNQQRWGYSWPTMEEAEEEVAMLCEPEHIGRVALDGDGNVLGWIGGLPEYDGNVWELHPMVVHPEQRGKGIGQRLIADLEAQVAARGGLTITLGSDDQDEMTSLGGANLYENLWEKVAQIQNYKNHPFSFYMKMGYVITGVVPDANGRGRPDILMSKRVGS
jgi:aminoglycoside 6'-N-acetyltransferase I